LHEDTRVIVVPDLDEILDFCAPAAGSIIL
jgi:hypothetical protein